MLIAHYSLLDAHCSLLTAHCSLLKSNLFSILDHGDQGWLSVDYPWVSGCASSGIVIQVQGIAIHTSAHPPNCTTLDPLYPLAWLQSALILNTLACPRVDIEPKPPSAQTSALAMEPDSNEITLMTEENLDLWRK